MHLSDHAKKIATLISSVVAVIGFFTGSFSFIMSQYLKPINEQLTVIENKLEKQELNITALQLQKLLTDSPEQTTEILQVAKHYFVDLNGNWYMHSLFDNWKLKNNIIVEFNYK